MQQKLNLQILLLAIVIFNFAGLSGQIINGPNKVTIGTTTTYYSPCEQDYYYDWDVSSEGDIIVSNSDSCTIEWLDEGEGQLEMLKYNYWEQSYVTSFFKTVEIIPYLIEYDYDAVGNRIQMRVVEFNDNKKSARSTEEVKESIEASSGTIVYPNPTSDQLFVKVEKEILEAPNGKLSIYSSQGNLLYSSSVQSTIQEIDMSEYKPGIYFLILSYNTSSINYKIIKH